MLDDFMRQAEKEIRSNDPPVEGTIGEQLDVMKQLKNVRFPLKIDIFRNLEFSFDHNTRNYKAFGSKS